MCSIVFNLLFFISISLSKTLPNNLIVGYASWGECDDKIIKAVEDGVNILIWFAINLLTNSTTGLISFHLIY